MRAEFQPELVGECKYCKTRLYHLPDEEKSVWVPGYEDCLHELKRYEPMWRVICRHGLTPDEIEAYKIDILQDHEVDDDPDHFEAIVFANSKNSYTIKVVEVA